MRLYTNLMYVGLGTTLFVLLFMLTPFPLTESAQNALVIIFFLSAGGMVVSSIMANKKLNFHKSKEMRKSTANFHYEMKQYGPMHYIAIEDFGGPFKSVTNDIENVVEDIKHWEGIQDMRDYFIIYKDSMDLWDGWDPTKGDFVHLEDENEVDAAKHFYTLLTQSELNDNEIYERQEEV